METLALLAIVVKKNAKHALDLNLTNVFLVKMDMFLVILIKKLFYRLWKMCDRLSFYY
jgi:hypothetical protein